MHVFDIPFATPADSLAADEALLDWCEAGHGSETLAFWEPREPFVVLGYAKQVAGEVNVAVCAARGVPIFRRCSGGGTVVQMPGGLNYSLVLRITEAGPTRNISSANQFIMEKNCAAIQTVLAAKGGWPMTVSVRGHTDLAIAPGDARPDQFRKIAGNAQRRRKQFLLFHGTFLLNCDLSLIDDLLPMPALQPDYRARRPHGQFVANLRLPVSAVKAALAREWCAETPLADPPLVAMEKLAREKYSRHDWNHKF
jgi:lipoate-protein ligase A